MDHHRIEPPRRGGAWRLAFGVPALLAYLAGSLAVTLAMLGAAKADSLADFWDGSETTLGLGGLLLLLGISLQAIRVAGQGAPEVEARVQQASWRGVGWALGTLLAPLALGWLQFELYWEEVTLVPVASLGGGVWLGLALAGRLAHPRHWTTAAMLLVAVVGLPLAALSFVVPTEHFRRHGTAVVYLVTDEHYGQREHRFEPDLPDAPSVPAEKALGRGTAALIGAFSEAKPVEGVILDGVVHVKDEQGRLVPVERGDVDQMWKDAAQEDKAERAEQLEAFKATRAAHEAEVTRLKRGGRIFSRSGD